MQVVREIFWWSVLYDFKIKAVHIAGVRNVLADAVSRLHCKKSFNLLEPIFNVTKENMRTYWVLYFLKHMSFNALRLISFQVVRWLQH